MREFQFVATEDGSLSLKNPLSGESMHSLRGAFSESLYIYLEALKECLQFTRGPRIFSLGLGLAYNEIISIAHLEKNGIQGFNIVSYEKNSFLCRALLRWMDGEKDSPLPYDNILERTARKFDLSSERLKEVLISAFNEKRWVIGEALERETSFVEKFNCIYYDAFSEKTSPELWSHDALCDWLQRACAPHCVFGTYAAKGVLNRALKEQGFALKKRAGFAGKKESTLAIR